MAHQTAEEMYEESLTRTTVAVCQAREWIVLLTCSTCGHGGTSKAIIEVSELAKYPPEMTMKELAGRATFACGHRGAWVDHRQSRGRKMPYMPLLGNAS